MQTSDNVEEGKGSIAHLRLFSRHAKKQKLQRLVLKQANFMRQFDRTPIYSIFSGGPVKNIVTIEQWATQSQLAVSKRLEGIMLKVPAPCDKVKAAGAASMEMPWSQDKCGLVGIGYVQVSMYRYQPIVTTFKWSWSQA